MTNLFVAHNRMHDFSYYLGFTEENYNLQHRQRRPRAARRGNDPEIGNAQAGAITGANRRGLGRDNANQIALQDGIPGITNQYLFQPIAGAFYAPCTDGGLDMSIVGHEYTHAISNRMVGGPDEGITSEQGGAMGESWGDLIAGEYHVQPRLRQRRQPVGRRPLRHRQPDAAIRDYAIDHNPLNYSDYGFDTTGVEVHADGEIWNGTMWEVRQALVDEVRRAVPLRRQGAAAAVRAGDPTASPDRRRGLPGQPALDPAGVRRVPAPAGRHARCSTPATRCSRPTGCASAAPTRAVLWNAFARRGMGVDAVGALRRLRRRRRPASPPRRRQPRPFTFRDRRRGAAVYVGDYEARVTPVADTVAGTPLGATAPLHAGHLPDAVRLPRPRLHPLHPHRPAAGPADDRARRR